MRFILLISLFPLLAACQAPNDLREAWNQTGRVLFMPHYDTVSAKTLVENVVPGTTSQVDVYNLLGAPSSVSHANQLPQGITAASRPDLPKGTAQVWTYHLSETRNSFPVDPRPVRFHTVTATLLFDYQGRVLDYRLASLTR